MNKKEKKCNCSFCKLRKIQNENTLEHLQWLSAQEEECIKNNQKRNIELIELCVKNR